MFSFPAAGIYCAQYFSEKVEQVLPISPHEILPYNATVKLAIGKRKGVLGYWQIRIAKYLPY